MVSKNQIKLIASLQQKKYRKQHKLFITEGAKVIQELLQSNFELEQLFITEDIFSEVSPQKKIFTDENGLKKITALVTPNNCLALFRIPKESEIIDKDLIVALDDIRDPGNLGTIIRLCDWFGIKHIVCSEQTVDSYNFKVVQATMGSIARVAVHYVNLEVYLKETSLPIFGTFMDGDNIYVQNLPTQGIIVMGNEANGISLPIEKIIKNRLTIPRFGNLQQTESLNVATATAIVLNEFKRKSINGK